MRRPTEVTEAISEHGSTRDSLIPVLQTLNEHLGYLPPDALAEVSRRLRLPPAEVHAVASFYGMLSLAPLGRHIVQLCESAPCHVAGGRALCAALCDALTLEPGQTSPDGTWSLKTVSCLGQCDGGPVLLVDGELHRNVTPEQVASLLARYEGVDS